MKIHSNILHGRRMAADGNFLVAKRVFWEPPQMETLDDLRDPNNLRDAVRVWAKGLIHEIGPEEFKKHGFYGALAHNFIESLHSIGVSDPPQTIRVLHSRHPRVFHRWATEKRIRPEIFRTILREYEVILQKELETV